jgi:hypothetical protein
MSNDDDDPQTRLSDLLVRLENEKKLQDAIDRVKDTCDLTEIFSLLAPPGDQATRERLEKLAADYRLKRKKMGRPKLQTTREDVYALAGHYAQELAKAQELWEGVEGSRGVKPTGGKIDASAEFDKFKAEHPDAYIVGLPAEFVVTAVQRLLECDPIAVAAKHFGVGAAPLSEDMKDRIGWNRYKKPGDAQKIRPAKK